MARNKNGDAATTTDPLARLETTPEDRAKAAKWFQRARELGEKRQFDYAIEYYVNGLEFWPDAVDDACKPLHGCAVARKQTGGKKPGLKDTMRRSMSDKDARRAYLNALWLFGHDPDNVGYVEGVVRNANRLRADDAARWAGGVCLKALEVSPKCSAKQIHTLAGLLEELGDRGAARNELPFAEAAYQMGLDALNLLRRRFPKDDKAEGAIKNLSTKLTILKGKYEKSESFRESVVDTEEQMELHDRQRTVQSEERLAQLIAKAEEAYRRDPDNATALAELVNLLCRREHDEEETRAIGILVEEYKRTGNYRWKLLADDIRMKQLVRRARQVAKTGSDEEKKAHRVAQLRFELGVYKERLERYPTDNRIRFEYAVRNFQAGRFDEAIPLFQAARVDPKNRTACGLYLGRCFFKKKYYPQAVAALEEAIREHPYNDDDLAKSMLYWLGRSREAAGQIDEARQTYGRIVQLDYNYADVRARLDALPDEK